MIRADILRKLVPNRFPDDEFRASSYLFDYAHEGPQQWIGVWSEYLRSRLQAEAQGGYLAEAFDRTGLVAAGIFRLAEAYEDLGSSEFPVVNGYQFGAILLRGARLMDMKENSIVLERGQSRAPLLESVAIFNPHASATPDGYVAVIYEDDERKNCGITAGHVVERYRRGQRVPIVCSECGNEARLVTRAPGYIDAAKVEFPCGGPSPARYRNNANVRSAVEGEMVHIHLGSTGKKICTVMMSLSSPSEIRSAATPRHFLTDQHGHYGDSGSLVSAAEDDPEKADLIGIYLGDTNCEEPNGSFVTYGYAVDLRQAASLLGAHNLKGDFHG